MWRSRARDTQHFSYSFSSSIPIRNLFYFITHRISYRIVVDDNFFSDTFSALTNDKRNANGRNGHDVGWWCMKTQITERREKQRKRHRKYRNVAAKNDHSHRIIEVLNTPNIRTRQNGPTSLSLSLSLMHSMLFINIYNIRLLCIASPIWAMNDDIEVALI